MVIKQLSLKSRSPECNTGMLICCREHKVFNASPDGKCSCSTEQEFGWSQEVRLITHERENPFILQISQNQKDPIKTLNLTEYHFSLSVGVTETSLAALKSDCILKNVVFIGHSVPVLCSQLLSV